MNRALVTFATGTHEELLEIALPSYEAFADRHGYDLIVADLECDRAPSWWKLPILKTALAEYGDVLLLDADIVIVDPSQDLPVPAEAWQAMVRHHTGDGEVPNCAVWYVRRPMIPYLDRAWLRTNYLHHGWWEQAAMLELLGYQPDPRPARLIAPTELYKHTFWLDNGFNHHVWDTPGAEHVRFAHATMHPDRAQTMRDWADNGVPEPISPNCRHRYFIEPCPDCREANVTVAA